MSSEATHVVGIDLGTTHCVLAASRLDRPAVRVVDVPQLVAPGEVAARGLLPSFLYLPASGELSPQSLPWGGAGHIVGELARRLGARSPTRLVSSAKSWICHGGVNRRAPILPWAAPDSEPHVSPFEAQVAYLAHVRAAWEAAHPGALLAAQDVVVTVPASFDDAAKQLTQEAARDAGLGEVRLLEEPQAAFYDYLAGGEPLGEDTRLVLVVDVGGGTTDLTLLRVLPDGSLERIAVGGHLVLGGDNMDAALAHHVVDQLGGRRLDPSEWSALVQAAREAKERLLAADAPNAAVVSVQRRGSRLVGGTESVSVTRDEAHRLLLDGFVPKTGPAEVAVAKGGRAGLTTLGLPYVTDPAIPRHVCAFLRKHAEAARAAGARVVDGLPRPDRLLLNGGVFNGPALVARFAEVLAGWYGEPVPLLRHESLDLAVARGAARYALARRGLGELIGGGSARAYYLGVTGAGGEPTALCVAPHGSEEGQGIEVRDRVFELVLDRPVVFPLYAYTGDRADAAGALVPIEASFDALPPVETVLRAQPDMPRTGGSVSVRVAATMSAAGTLELSLVTVSLPPKRWRLELSLSKTPPATVAPEPPAEPVSEPAGRAPGVEKVPRLVEAAFADTQRDDKAQRLRADLEAALGPRGGWSVIACRAVFDACMHAAGGRGASETHEQAWLRLCGFGMRPGFGASGDRERLARLWQLHGHGLLHPTGRLWPEWWILWRRVAPGLGAGEQAALFAAARPAFADLPNVRRPGGLAELVQLLGALERLPAAAKQEAGAWVLARAAKLPVWLTLGRLGARLLLAADGEVVPRHVAEAWLGHLLPLDWEKAAGAAFAATLLARVSGDAVRDLEPGLRAVVAARLREAKAPASWIDMVNRRTGLSSGDAAKLLGEAPPVGLRLHG